MKPTFAIVGAGALLAAAALMSGCSRSVAAQSGGLTLTGSKYCTPFKNAPDSTSAAAVNAALNDPANAFDDCIHRWGYTLAPARDPADVVAQAAVDACGPILSAWNQQLTGQSDEPTSYRGRSSRQQMQAPSPAQQQIRQAEAKALFYVVQARAAGCSAPPANTLLAVNTLNPANGNTNNGYNDGANPNNGNPYNNGSNGNPNNGNPYNNPNNGNPNANGYNGG